MMKKLFSLFVILLLSLNFVNAQQMKKPTESRFVYSTGLGFVSGVGYLNFENDTRHIKNGIPVIDVHQLIAYQFNPYVFTGIGVGVDIWKHTAFIPIYANVSVNFIDKKVSPHWYLNAGYSFKWYVSNQPEMSDFVIYGSKTGLYGETGLGINVKVKDKVSILVVANYKLQDSYLRYSVNNEHEDLFTNRETRMLYHFVGFKFAVIY